MENKKDTNDKEPEYGKCGYPYPKPGEKYDPWIHADPALKEEKNLPKRQSFLFIDPDDLIEDKQESLPEIPEKIYYPLSEVVKQFPGFSVQTLVSFMIKNEFIFTNGSLCDGWYLTDTAIITEIDHNKFKVELTTEAVGDLLAYYEEHGWRPYRIKFE